jgi:hypothetical protein
MAYTFRAHILAFRGNWLSGLAVLQVLLANGNTRFIHCENAPTVRALDACFGNIIGPNHTARIPAEVRKREVVLSVDGMGILLAFTPLEDWTWPDVPDEGIHDSSAETITSED